MVPYLARLNKEKIRKRQYGWHSYSCRYCNTLDYHNQVALPKAGNSWLSWTKLRGRVPAQEEKKITDHCVGRALERCWESSCIPRPVLAEITHGLPVNWGRDWVMDFSLAYLFGWPSLSALFTTTHICLPR